MTDSNPLKILFLDLETAPNLGFTWEKYETNVIEFVTERYMLSATVKWLGDSKPETFALCDFPMYQKDKQSDLELAQKLWEYIDQADIVCAHNGDHFDIPVMNTRFLANGLNPPSPYRTIDTLKVAKKHFSFNSNKLNDLGQFLELGKKVDTGGFQLWKDCMEGKKTAWDKMKKYNKVDVLLLEKVYLKLRPWMKTHPNLAVTVDKLACSHCGSKHTQRRGYSYTRLTKYHRLQCLDCASWSQGPMEKAEKVEK